VLPLGSRPGKKYPPPHGWTGHGAPYPSAADIAAWQESHGDRNIGLRLPPGVLGLDVDAYGSKRGGETLAALIAKHGELPPTWITTARTDGVSGIRLFRVPIELDGRPINWPGEAGTHIEIIQTGHRYAVVWPSTNPEADGARYEWRIEQGPAHERTLAVVEPERAGERIVAPGELPMLPEPWVRGLALAYDRTEKADLADGALAQWWAALRPGPACRVVETVLAKALADLRDVDGSRHESARDAAAALARLGGEGHAGAAGALGQLAAGFERAVGKARAVDGGEWRRLLSGAVKLAAADNRAPRTSCEHDAATPVVLPPELAAAFSLPGLADVSTTTASAPPDALAVATPDPGAQRVAVDAAIADVEAMPSDERDDAVRQLAAELVLAGIGEAELQRARAALTVKGGASGVRLGEWDAIARDARKQAKEAAKAAAEVGARLAAHQQLAAKREAGQLLPPPHAPIDVARELAASLPAPAKWWRGDFYLWDGTRYRVWRDEAVDNWLYGRTADAYFEGSGDDAGPKPWRPNENRIAGVAHALSRGVLYHASEFETDDSPSQVACANGVYDVATGELLPHTPQRFNLQSVPFPYDADAVAPSWATFLDDALPKDAQLFLQEWFGYVLSGRTDLEKIANLVGPPRSGKGTIATVLEALIGGENVASPSMPSLVGTFGEQPLIGKTLAVFSDISWQHRDIVTGVEILKAISGQDTRDVNRKNREIWHGRLGVRFMIMGNDMPKFTDASGALAGRMIHVQFTRSVAGREDPTLKPRLVEELAGILNWALDGLRRLGANGRFTVPQTSAELAAEVRRQQSPVQGFLDDRCAFTEAARPTPLDELYPVYRAWAKDADVERVLDRERFSRALSSAGLTVERKMINGIRARRVHGIVPANGLTSWSDLLNPHVSPATAVDPPEGFMP
jgi:putative DNA primase/helicase